MKYTLTDLWHRTQYRIYLSAGVILITLLLGASAYSQKVVMDLSGKAARGKTVQALKAVSQRQKEEAQALAQAKGWPVRGMTSDKATFELIKIENGRPFYLITHNVNAALTTRTNLVRNTVPYNVNGSGLIAGVWDGENMRVTHREFGGRAVIMDDDGAWSSDHGTHVAGTIGAAGVDAAALGMAPSVSIHYYAWGNDFSEMTSRAATGPAQADAIYLSNHSYGWITGWTVSGSTYYWFGVLEEREDRGFGLYDEETSAWDDLCYNAPYYLPFK
ncbi:MAG TPA: S8 family serine peptidase, partial [Candidatus Hydrogenedentes bacterium]|nr:S8 family serine peptidase [Candidatus Hydrogenedentota bacterium]